MGGGRTAAAPEPPSLSPYLRAAGIDGDRISLSVSDCNNEYRLSVSITITLDYKSIS